MATFLSLPQEVIEHALVKLDIRDVTSVAQSCRQLRSIIYLNNSLWRALFLCTFDDPRLTSTYLPSAFLFSRAGGGSPPRYLSPHPCKATRGSDLRVGYDWLAEFQRRTISRSILLSSEHGVPGGDRVPVRERVKALLTIVDMVLAAVSIPPAQLLISRDLAWVEELLSVMDDQVDGYKLYLPSHVGRAGTDAASLGLAAAPDHVTWAWPSEGRPIEDEAEHHASSGATTPCSLVTLSELSANGFVNRRSAAEPSDGHVTYYEEAIDADEDFVEQERILRARLRLVRGYSNSEKALIASTITASGSKGSNKHEPQDLRLYARSRVYDLRRYKASNNWGPLIPSLLLSQSPSRLPLPEPPLPFPTPAGRSSHPAPHVFPPPPLQMQPQDLSSAGPRVRVDWEQVEAVLIDASMNIYDHIDHDPANCPRIMNPYGLENSRAYSAPGCESHTMEYAPDGDWAGINGRWNRLISFCDYRDLRTYNVSSLSFSWKSLGYFIFKLIQTRSLN